MADVTIFYDQTNNLLGANGSRIVYGGFSGAYNYRGGSYYADQSSTWEVHFTPPTVLSDQPSNRVLPFDLSPTHNSR